MKFLKSALTVVACTTTALSFASTSMQLNLQSLSPQITTWAQQSIILSDLQAANAKHADYSKAKIRSLNKQWKQELKSSDKPLIGKVMNNGLSALLNTIEDHSKGLYQGIMITDNYGLSIGQTYISPNYYQGSQKTWKKGYAASPAKPYIVEGSTKKGKIAPAIIAMPILDANGKTVGVVEVNIDKTKLSNLPAQS
ncbi:MAG: hypothetical protein Q7V63_01555 [Gammaproteobacteria bacterium]|nr:hypothetical protein [Gammaproteobacteria bacterium]